MIDYYAGHKTIVELQAELLDLVGAELSHIPNYKTIQALAATYELQDYFANKIAEIGEPPEGEGL